MNGDDSVIRLLRKVQGRKKNKHTTSDIKSSRVHVGCNRSAGILGTRREPDTQPITRAPSLWWSKQTCQYLKANEKENKLKFDTFLLLFACNIPNNEGPGQALCFLIEEINASCQRNCDLHGKIFYFIFTLLMLSLGLGEGAGKESYNPCSTCSKV